jgi:hypothetical protein
LSDAKLTISDPNQEIRNRKVIDQNDYELGNVGGLSINPDEKTSRIPGNRRERIPRAG